MLYQALKPPPLPQKKKRLVSSVDIHVHVLVIVESEWVYFPGHSYFKVLGLYSQSFTQSVDDRWFLHNCLRIQHNFLFVQHFVHALHIRVSENGAEEHIYMWLTILKENCDLRRGQMVLICWLWGQVPNCKLSWCACICIEKGNAMKV